MPTSLKKPGNRYIKEFFERHGRYYDLLFDREDRDRTTALETVVRHREILDALIQRDWTAAREALRRDIRCAHPTLSAWPESKIDLPDPTTQ